MKAESHNELAEMLRLDLEARGEVWDEPPCLSFLYEGDDGWHISKINLPDHFWQPNPAAILELMAQSVGLVMSGSKRLLDMTRQIRPAEWRGIAFFSESWMVEQVKQSPDDDMDPVFMEMAEARMLHQHPAREEARTWWASLADGTAIAVALKRVSGDVRSSVWPPGAGDKEKPEYLGRIPHSLEKLTKVMSQA